MRQRAHIDNDAYLRLYQQSVERPDTFWAEQAKQFRLGPNRGKRAAGDLLSGQGSWFQGGQLNVSYNCIDRHLAARGEANRALIWEITPANRHISPKSCTTTSVVWPMC